MLWLYLLKLILEQVSGLTFNPQFSVMFFNWIPDRYPSPPFFIYFELIVSFLNITNSRQTTPNKIYKKRGDG